MRIFAPKHKPSQEAQSTSFARHGRAFSRQGREVSLNPNSQHSIGNNTAGRPLKAHQHEIEGESHNSTSPLFGHDFSRIPVHSSAPREIQPNLMTNTPGDIYKQQEHWNEVPIQLGIQKKSLEVSNPNNLDEIEADEVARKVVNGQSAEILGTSETVNRKEEGSAETTAEFQSKLERSKGSGQLLDDGIRSEMESKMGSDFSGVRIHTGIEAHNMSQSVNAKAFTHELDIFFKQGEFNTSSRQGKELLAHELVHTAQSQSGQVINREFDKETATQRIKGTKNIKEYRLLGVNGAQIKYDADDAINGYKGYIYLPEGTLVSKLDPNPSDPKYIHVIAWHNMKYREGYIHKSAFSSTYEGGSSFDVEVFINDAHHTVHRVELLLKRRAQDDKQVQHLRTMLADIDSDLTAYKKGEIQITAEMLEKIKKEDQKALMIDQSNKPETINRLSSAIFEATNPITSEQLKLSDTALYVPLTDTWFQSDEKLKEHYESVITKNANLLRFIGDSGEGIQDMGYIKEWFDEFALLRHIIKGRPIAGSPEGKWLDTITPDVQKRIKRMVFLSGNTWPAMAKSKSRYAEYVAVNTSFGPLQANPLMMLLMHELNVNTDAGISLMGQDSHIGPDETKSTWESANKGDFSKTIANDSDQLDNLFQAQSGIALTLLSRYLKKIKSMQPPDKKYEE